MHKAVCCVPVSAVRADPSHKSEMVTQLLFGEGVDIKGQEDNWLRMKSWYDGYEGWVLSSHVIPVVNETDKHLTATIVGDWINVILFEGKEMHIPFGCDISIFKDPCTFPDKPAIVYSGKIWKDDRQKDLENRIQSISLKFINTSYLWGGKSVFGIDCSGFTQSVFRLLGIPLLRDAFQQAEQGTEVAFEDILPGDTAFFENENGRITHVGILMRDYQIIHASGKVRIDDFDKEGIRNTDTNQRTHKLTTIRRYF